MSLNPKSLRKNKIIQTALKIFAEKGFQEATISEISKAAGVSEATVYEYFKTKEDLLFAIPEEITEEAFNEWEKILPYLRDTESKLRAMIQGHMQLYQNNPHYSALVMLNLKTNRNFLNTKAYKIIQDIARKLLNYIQEGIDNGTFKKDIDPYLVRAMLLGTVENLCIRWHLLGAPSNLADYVDPIINLILNGIKVPARAKSFSLHLNISEDGTIVQKSENTTEKSF